MTRPPGPWWAELPPAAGAAVMATGIVSIGLHLVGHETLSLAALALAGAVWLVLAVDFSICFLRDRPRWRAEADTPAALTAVAATAVLGTRLSVLGRQDLALTLLALAAVLWPFLLASVLRHRRRRMPGGAFLVCVATQGLAVLAATLAAAGEGDWPARAALALFCLGVLLYGEALVRFDFRQVWTGAGDQWIAGGALAISALACAKLTASPLWTGGAHHALRDTTLVLLGLALAWYAILLTAELVRPRPHYDLRRWATVFPLGMTAVATLSTGTSAQVGGLRTLGEVLLWVAVAAWALTPAAFLVTQATGRARTGPAPRPAPDRVTRERPTPRR
ncbi:tellurite resistance/C4-dicarboxylate transporter family protein [Streptomyces sp. NPDC051597]|uniref:tellurite resistance/C4-dicarboxylate transporter family protein n=1 Tax=Streptomyces sp. NPDC051597 TaxID=3155049 RepID=UPI00342D1D82